MHGPSTSPAAPMGKKLIASVAGNHDLGFASGIQPAVKSRFDAHFGPLNRFDVLGNHSIVSLDTVSLSAMDQVDPKTGGSGAGDGSALATANSHLWRPVEDFLTNARPRRQRAVQHEYRKLQNMPRSGSESLGFKLFVPEARDLSQAWTIERTPEPFPTIPTSQFPTIVLTHVPLFRPADTNCGPLREGGPSISLSAGYQYQNVLTPLISQDIIKHLVPEEVAMVYSGDDHDYCEIEHNEFTGRIKEITVKSMSWAMGVRKPGVQLLSLWNPVNLDALTSQPDLPTPKDTIQNHLCILPNQLNIFIRYSQLLALTLIVLTISAIRSQPLPLDHDSSHQKSEPLLPLHQNQDSQNSTASSSESEQNQTLLKTRNTKLGGYGNLPPTSRSSSPQPQSLSTSTPDPFAPAPYTNLIDSVGSGSSNSTHHRHSKSRSKLGSDDWGMPSVSQRRQMARAKTRFQVFLHSLRDVAVPVLLWYAWLFLFD